MSFRSDRGAVRPMALISEAARIAFSTPAASLVTAAIVGAVCAVILVTTGQTVQAEQDVLGRIDDAGTRLVVAIDDRGTANIDPHAVDRIAALSNVQWVIGLGYAQDARNANIGSAATPVPVRTLWGAFPDVIAINGRAPKIDEGIAGDLATRTLGMSVPVGGVDVEGIQIAIVGGFVANKPLQDLNRSILRAPPADDTTPLRSVHVVATSPREVAGLTTAIAMLLAADDPTAIRFDTSQTLADVRAAVAGELGQYSRSLVLGALASGLALASLAIYASVTLRRQDFGRRRALGATRMTIVALVTTHYALVAMPGIAVGVATGTYFFVRWTGAAPDVRFSIAVAILTLLATLVATIPPSLFAAYRDPVRVLRVP